MSWKHRWGLLSKTGKPILKSVLGFMLRNPFYYGVMEYKGEMHEANHPPLISKKLFDQVQAELCRRAKPIKHGKIKFTFLGLMKCGECGASITAEKQKGHIYYRCTKKIRPCTQKFLREEALLQQINKAMLKVYIDDATKEQIFHQWEELVRTEGKASSSFASQLEGQIKAIDAKIERDCP